MTQHNVHFQLIQYLQEEFSIPETVLQKVIRFIEKDIYLLPIALWQYELLTVNQLDQVYDWLAITLKEDRQEQNQRTRTDDGSAMAG